MATKAIDKLPACKLSTVINKKFMTVQMIGKGSYGVVYEVIRLNSPTTRFACKAELAVAHNNLKTEWDLMTLLKDNKSKHNVIGVELGAERNYNYIVMHLVGPSLADLRKTMPKKTFSLYTTTVCAIQCFDSLVELQKLGYIHRDVKPGNFAIGVLGSEEEKLVYILDFGLCRNMFKKNELRKPRMKAPFRGTIIYCSLNIHHRMEPGRHDDIWSLFYMMIEFHLGDLPWDKLTKEETKKSKEKKIDELLSKCPTEFKMIRCHLLTLCYSHVPDYVKLRAVLCQIMHVNKFTPDMPLDWQVGGEQESIFKPRAAVFAHKWSKKKVVLSELLDLPKPGDKLLTEKDFPQPGEQEPPHDESVSKSDDTITEKEGPIPVPKAKSAAKISAGGRLSAEHPKPPTAQASLPHVATRPAPLPLTSIAPKVAPPPLAAAAPVVAPPKPQTATVAPKPPQVSVAPSLPPPAHAPPATPKPPTTMLPQPPLPKAPVPAVSVAAPPATAMPQPPKLTIPGVSVGMPPAAMLPPPPKAAPSIAHPLPPKAPPTVSTPVAKPPMKK